MENSEARNVPASVFEDLVRHPELVPSWVNDRGFREEVVRATDPAAAVERLLEISLEEETKGWINRRVAALGPEELLDFSRPIPF